jgi:hypothetical protein
MTNNINVANIDTLINALKEEEIAAHFNMTSFCSVFDPINKTDFFNACGTTACIAGMIAFLENEVIDPHRYDFERKGAAYLGLSRKDCGELFYAWTEDVLEFDQITTEDAIKVLENLKETGIVDWSVAH